MAKCYFCGRGFRNKQGVRRHLGYCFAYQNRDDVAWGDTVEMKRQIEMLKHKIDMVKLYDDRGAEILLGGAKVEKNPAQSKTVGVVCYGCGAVIQVSTNPKYSYDCPMCGAHLSIGIIKRNIAKGLEEKQNKINEERKVKEQAERYEMAYQNINKAFMELNKKEKDTKK